MTNIARRIVVIFVTTISVMWAINYQKKVHARHHEITSSHADNAGIQHLSIIMDGNRRWAQKRGLEKWQGHKAGMERIKLAIEFARERNIPHLSLWTFSLHNFARSSEELNYLFNVLAQEFAKQEAQSLIDAGIRVRFIGDRTKFPETVISLINDIEEKSKKCTALNLYLLFCYSGREEIIDACQRIAHQIEEGNLSSHEISETLFRNYLWTTGIPDPDLIIRTGDGNTRLSNFMQYQCAFSELYFTDCYWPDITKKELEKAVNFFAQCKRNFGK